MLCIRGAWNTIDGYILCEKLAIFRLDIIWIAIIDYLNFFKNVYRLQALQAFRPTLVYAMHSIYPYNFALSRLLRDSDAFIYQIYLNFAQSSSIRYYYSE